MLIEIIDEELRNLKADLVLVDGSNANLSASKKGSANYEASTRLNQGIQALERVRGAYQRFHPIHPIHPIHPGQPTKLMDIVRCEKLAQTAGPGCTFDLVVNQTSHSHKCQWLDAWMGAFTVMSSQSTLFTKDVVRLTHYCENLSDATGKPLQ